MCFSATASFTASALLVGVGVRAFYISKSKSHYWLASIPFIFALQQFFEGIVWVSHSIPDYGLLHYVTQHIFLIFAFLIWPFYIPLSVYFAEKQVDRKKVLLWVLRVGILTSFIGLYLLIKNKEDIAPVANHVLYNAGMPNKTVGVFYIALYLASTVLPLFITSLKRAKWLGLAFLISFIFTIIFMYESFVSTWCFFSAVLSFTVLFLI